MPTDGERPSSPLPSSSRRRPSLRSRTSIRPRRRNVTLHSATQAGTRLLGWLTDLVAILIMAYIVRCWPSMGGAVTAGLVGTAVAMINDSWEMVAHVDLTRNFHPLAPPRAVMNDLFSLAVCMGGLMLLIFADIREEREADITHDFGLGGDWGKKRHLMTLAQWLLAAVVLWRFVFAVWGGCNCSRQRRQRNGRQRPRVRIL